MAGLTRRNGMTFLRLMVAGALLSLSSVSLADALTGPEKERYGIIQELDFGANTMIFEGYRYRMAPELIVEIRGTYGAFTMLQPGMKAKVTYRLNSPSEREVVRIEHLPDNYPLERV
jgi:hypothetical protein